MKMIVIRYYTRKHRKGGVFVDYPTQAGAFYQWGLPKTDNSLTGYFRRAYHPAQPAATGYPSTGYWSQNYVSENSDVGFLRTRSDDGYTNTGTEVNLKFAQRGIIVRRTGILIKPRIMVNILISDGRVLSLHIVPRISCMWILKAS